MKMCFKMYQFKPKNVACRQLKIYLANKSQFKFDPRETRTSMIKHILCPVSYLRLTTVKNTMLILFNQQWRCNMMLYVHNVNNAKMLFICLPHLGVHRDFEGEAKRPIYFVFWLKLEFVRNKRIPLSFTFLLVAELSTFWFHTKINLRDRLHQKMMNSDKYSRWDETALRSITKRRWSFIK